MLLSKKYILGMVIFLLLSLGMVLASEDVPLITAKDGILYKDGKPCFLTGVWSLTGYDAGLWINDPTCKGHVDFVPGKKGRGLKFSFDKTDKPIGRWVDFSDFDPRVWVQKKYKVLKFWVKGDGSENVFVFKIQNWPPKPIFEALIGKFSLKDTDWKQVVIPLEDKYEVLAKANYCDLVLDGHTDKEFYFILDEITAEGDEGEIVLYDFTTARSEKWSQRSQREKFKDDPVYKAVWDDPLYREISRENFETIGMFTFHLATVSDAHVRDLGPMTRSDSSPGEVYLCEALKGMPMVPGFVFDWGVGENFNEYAKKHNLPPTMFMRTPDGSFIGGYSTICFEDPFAKKLYKELWQRGARHLLKHGANIYAYELINENSGFHSDAHPYERELFIKRIKEKYGDISGLNKVWGTDYKSFDEVMKKIPELGGVVIKKIKGLSIEWEKFQEDRYVEMLRQGGEWIHEVEDELNKPHALMGVMGGTGHEFYGWGGSDMYKMAQGLDIIETEDGVRFGTKYDIGEVDRLTLVVASKEQFDCLMNMDLVDAASGDKPIINTEHNFIRFRGGFRQPTTKADIITSLWEEFLRGVSATHTYWWGVGYFSQEDALARAITDQQLLSPYVYPRESLNGFKEVQEEIGRVADVLMDRPRLGRDAEVAILFSRPTARYLIGFEGWRMEKPNPFHSAHLNLHSYLLENHYPLRYLYEEQLSEQNINKYKVIFIPHSDYIYPGTLRYLTDYVRKGGTLVCFGDAFGYDEYGNKKDNSSLLGLKQEEVDVFAETVKLVNFGKVKIISKRKIILSNAEMLVDFLETKSPFITVNNIDKGKVYYVNADTFRLEGQDSQIDPIMDYIMDKVNLTVPIEVVGINGEKEKNIEAHLIDRGDKKVIFIVNWLPYNDRIVKVKIKDIRDQDKYYLIDIAKNSPYTKGGQDIFTGKILKQGINLYLPEEERVVLLLTKERYKLSNKSVELMSDKEARELEKRIKTEKEREAATGGKSRKICFGIEGRFDTKSIDGMKIKECIKTVAESTLMEIKLKAITDESDILVYGLRWGRDTMVTYLLTYNDSLKEEEIKKIQDRIIDELIKKYKIKVIEGRSKRTKADEAAFWESQIYRDLDVSNCRPLDIAKQANMGFKDEKADDQKGGLFDEGRSLKGLPVGSNTFAGIVFDVIDPGKNNGFGCIVLRGQAKPYFPEKAEGIEVKQKVKNIYVLHNACYCGNEGTVYKLRLNYTDGGNAEVEIRAGREIKDWFNRDPLISFNLSNARLGWQGKAQEKCGQGESVNEIDVGLYCAKLANPHPEKEIRTLDIISANGKAVPAIFAVTLGGN